jgi:peptidoglycan/LPS O-acetylase OafA/YrhL
MKRSFGIDILRTGSIILVILRHYAFYTEFNWGYFAVESLFVVSGYLIGQMLFNSYYATPQVEVEALKKFMFRRWMRVFPLYYFLLLVKFIIAPAIGIKIIFYFLFIQNHTVNVDFYPVTWTLCIEEWFYVLTPLAIFVFMRYISNKNFHMLLLLIGTIILINFLRAFWVYKTDIPYGGIIGNVPLRQDAPLMGLLLAFIKFRYRPAFDKLNKLSVFIVGLILMTLFMWAMHVVQFPNDLRDKFVWTRTVSFHFLGLITALCLPFLEQSIPLGESKWMQHVNTFVKWGGKLSFALYLTHGEVLHLLVKWLKNDMSYRNISYIGIAITIGLSWFLHWAIEKRVLEWRDKKKPDNWQAKI